MGDRDQVGLWIFCIVILINATFLVFDGALLKAGHDTFSTTMGKHPWLAVLAVSLQIVGALAFIWHVMSYIEVK